MKKYIAIATLAAAGAVCANAADYVGSFAWTADKTPTLTFSPGEAPLTLTIDKMVIDGAAVNFTTADPKANSVYSGTLTPATNVGNGGSWSISFTIENTGDEVLTLESITFDAFAYNNGGTAQAADTLTREISFALTGSAETSVVHSFTNIDTSGDAVADVYNWDNNPTLTFTQPLEIAVSDSAEFTLSVSKSDSVGCFIGLSGLTVSTIPEPSAFGLLAGLGALALVGTRRRRR